LSENYPIEFISGEEYVKEINTLGAYTSNDNSATLKFRFKLDKAEPRYIMYFLMSPRGRELLNPQAGGGTYNISATEFLKVQIPYPNIEIQRQILSELDAQMNILKGLQGMELEAKQKTENILAKVWGLELDEPSKTKIANE
jgi:restriction endonuclease S subunit